MNKLNLKKLKENRGVTLTDVIVAIIILIMFMGVLTTSFYQIYKNNISIILQAKAADYAIKIAEGIDKMDYKNVTNEMNDNINIEFELDESYDANVEIENYNQEDPEKEDLIKIVTINVKYNIPDGDRTYTIKKLKIKEI